MSTDLDKLNEYLIEVKILHSNFDQMSLKVEKIQEEVININCLQSKMEDDIEKLKKDKDFIPSSNGFYKFFAGLLSFCFATGGAIYAYIEDQKNARDAQIAISIQELEEKKRRLEYNREKYLIRNGKWKEEDNGESQDK